jgi:hypothetical protein
MGYYDPPEPEFEGDDQFTCSMEVNRKFVTPDMAAELKRLRDGIAIPDPWAAVRPPEESAKLQARARERAISALLRAWSDAEEMDRTCGWEGEAHYIVTSGRIEWDCPCCGAEHTDEQAADRWGPDPDDQMDAAREALELLALSLVDTRFNPDDERHYVQAVRLTTALAAIDALAEGENNG